MSKGREKTLLETGEEGQGKEEDPIQGQEKHSRGKQGNNQRSSRKGKSSSDLEMGT